ncbi:efflux RND transporter periplasmic adaptor subunit [Vibrio rhizosphaerae]|uniref:Efflux RND transporter periplasmic adaptor subunit n=1 Tax=Vibrio rhizosphaerae TaxID=398736 RepID=A0ABU4IRY2_9VIBR|nr:efflux RND transporter periplasmic adaptor subunit [Vibrio rhizosphaerae]MDW6092125.1 efflux RND transporter periplasmic adaptor subunit [Vibrio rhizosphaerae]
MKKINICARGRLHILAVLFLVGCQPSDTVRQESSRPVGASADASEETDTSQAEPFVSTLAVQPTPLDVFEDLPARVTAFRVAEIRPQISAMVQHRLFQQGTEVKAGDSLYQLDPAPFQADVATARATLQKAQVTLKRARDKAAYLKPLAEADAISQQEYDDAVLQRAQARADVAQAEAMLFRRELDLNYTRVTAPISGRIDQTLVTEGALVSRADTAPMTRIQQIEQVFVDIRRPASSLASSREALATTTASSALTEQSDARGRIEILRSNGQPYPLQGQLLFSGINIDTGTGDVLLRVLVDNKQRLLLPGMFVKARVLHSHFARALTIPQQAVVHIGGLPHLWLIDSEQHAVLKAVQLGALVKGQYHVTAGLQAGDAVVVAGKERLRDGITVHQRPWQAPLPR